MAQRAELAAQTFLFADLSGFTALTEAHGDDHEADLVGGFVRPCAGCWPNIRLTRSRPSGTR
jgi:class 3 adenylate cyclase